MKTPDEMTVEECRDEIALDMGCKRSPHDGYIYAPIHDSRFPQYGHPIPATLDAAAAALPEHFFWSIAKAPRLNGKAVYEANASPVHEDGGTSFECITTDADTELLARFRLAVACRRAMKGVRS